MIIGVSSCSKTNLKSYDGTYDAKLVGGVGTTVDCTMDIVKNGNTLNITISDGGVNIDPDILVDVIDDGSDLLSVVTCTNKCYQGDMDITSGDLSKADGKVVLSFQLDGWIGIVVTEK